MAPRDAAGRRWVLLQHGGLLGREQRARTHDLPCPRGVLGRDEGPDARRRCAASASIFGASAPMTRCGGMEGGTAMKGAASIASR